MLQASNIHFCIQHRPIVDTAELHISPGKLTTIIGPNGAGKSTLLKILAGDIVCQHGTILYNGQNLKKLKAKDLAKIRAVMPQHSQLSFPFHAKEVVELGMIALGDRADEAIVREVMEETQTWHFKDKLYSQLSGGEKQRVQLSRVLAQIWGESSNPRYLLLDEPTSSLDIAHQHHVLHIASRLKSKNIGVLAVLHDLNMAAAYSDQVIMLKNGRIYQAGSVAETLTSEKLHHVYDYPIQVYDNQAYHGIHIQSLPIHTTSAIVKTA
ncbi:heme ABC transporter ATP-binding protein [Mongoliitalea daihaiensis]|uniref:heme ABC transporter ATP-binding protein n=1 Tax=Mongoliitalea daihaiensis TaxID=2782006 RepID=UPI001F1FF83A|nr:heme ABC transporter ATP-binding protein [Mongoliitalea daihaiensis]UJP65649.1 heme ABC transporter ATP-binding protein [Mongoliitalea daihaiensis]